MTITQFFKKPPQQKSERGCEFADFGIQFVEERSEINQKFEFQ